MYIKVGYSQTQYGYIRWRNVVLNNAFQLNAKEQNSYNANVEIDLGIRPSGTSDVDEFFMQILMVLIIKS